MSERVWFLAVVACALVELAVVTELPPEKLADNSVSEFEVMAEKCVVTMPDWDSYLAFNGAEYSCVMISRVGKLRVKQFLIAAKPAEGKMK